MGQPAGQLARVLGDNFSFWQVSTIGDTSAAADQALPLSRPRYPLFHNQHLPLAGPHDRARPPPNSQSAFVRAPRTHFSLSIAGVIQAACSFSASHCTEQ